MSARELTLRGGSPWGFRMHGGHDLHQPLRISRVNPGSKAAQQGVREGDLISSINGRSTRDITNSDAHALLRNAGDHLTLGLNQENVGSPKRRIYKSSLQENTSTETLRKTTIKTTTSNNRIISTETRTNGTDDTKNDRSYAIQNGGLKNTPTSETNSDTKRRELCDSLDYATDAEDSYTNMPHGSRNRKNRRNRNRKRYQPPQAENVPQELREIPEITINDDNESESKLTSDGETVLENVDPDVPASRQLCEMKVTTEDVDSDGDEVIYENVKSTKLPSNTRCRIEKKEVNAATRICEITTISNLPCEARIDHIAGVGILETGLTKGCEPTVTVVEPLEPLSSTVTSKVKTFGERTFALALLAKNNSLEIQEVSDSDVEPDNSRVVVVEAESDVEREPVGELVVIEKDVEEQDVEGDSDLEQYYEHLKESSALSEHSNPEVQKVEVAMTQSLSSSENLEEGITVEVAKADGGIQMSKSGAPISREVEEKLRCFIERLNLPSSPEEARDECQRAEEERSKSGSALASRKAKKRAILESYFTQTQAANRFLDIIQEEGDKISEGDEQHIRDFINEEISKYRREGRKRILKNSSEHEQALEYKTTREKTESTEFHDSSASSCTRNEDTPHTTIPQAKENAPKNKPEIIRVKTSFSKLPNIQDVRLENMNDTESLEHSHTNVQSDVIENHRDCNSSSSTMTSHPSHNHINGFVNENRKPPPLPKRSSSFGNDSEPQRPPTPPEIDYPAELPVIPPLPNNMHSAPKTPPLPPLRGKTTYFVGFEDSCDPPKRPPPPGHHFLESEDNPDPTYENLDFPRKTRDWETKQPLAPLPHPQAPIERIHKIELCESTVNTKQNVIDDPKKSDGYEEKQRDSSLPCAQKPVERIHKVELCESNVKTKQNTVNDLTKTYDCERTRAHFSTPSAQPPIERIHKVRVCESNAETVQNSINSPEKTNECEVKQLRSTLPCGQLPIERIHEIKLCESNGKTEQKTVDDTKNTHDYDGKAPHSSSHHTHPPVERSHKVRVCQSNVKTEQNTVEFIKTLLTVLSQHDTTSQDVLNILSGFDLNQLPRNVREIIDDLMAPSSRSSIESDSTELRNMESTAKPGNDATLEIAHEHTGTVPQKFVNFTHSTSPRANTVSEQRRVCHKTLVEEHSETKEFKSEVWSRSESSEGVRTNQSQMQEHLNEKKHDIQIHSAAEVEEKLVNQLNEKHEQTSSETETKIEIESSYNFDRERNIQEEHTSQLHVKNNQPEVVSNECETKESANSLSREISEKTGKCEEQESSVSAVSPTESQGQDSSSSTGTLSTAKYNPARSSLADITSVLREEEREEDKGKTLKESPQPKRKLNLLKDNHNPKDSSKNDVDSPPPIPYSPIEDLYYVPTDKIEDKLEATGTEEQQEPIGSKPDLLKDQCIKKILSMPYGLKIINEITLPKFNIFKNLQTIQESINTTSIKSDIDKLNPHGVKQDIDENNQAASRTITKNSDTKTIVSEQDNQSQTKQERSDQVNHSESTATSQEEMQRQRPHTWMGVPTTDDPRLLLCFSPSQQDGNVQTSADNLLDLHKKFLERRSYHEPRQMDTSIQKYRVEVCASNESGSESDASKTGGLSGRWSGDWHIPVPGNRLLEIIKENSVSPAASSKEQHPMKNNIVDRNKNAIYNYYSEKSNTSSGIPRSMTRVPSLDENQDRLKATRLSDWLNLARRNSVDGSTVSKSSTRNVLIEKSSRSKHESTDKSYFATEPRGNGVNSVIVRTDSTGEGSPGASKNASTKSVHTSIVNKEFVEKTSEVLEYSERSTGKLPEPGHYVNSALIDRSQDAPEASVRNVNTFRNSPMLFNSAIIDRSQNVPEVGRKTPIPKRQDARHNVNTALINHKPEVPPKMKRSVSVDRSCIDTTSIFDQAPPRNRLEPRRYHDPESAKNLTAAEIMDNLKQLQSDMRHQLDGRRRYSLPQEYFDNQLKYIEQLEAQLRNVVLAEEEEKKAFDDIVQQVQQSRQRPHSVAGESFARDTQQCPSNQTQHKQIRNEKLQDSWRSKEVSDDKDGYTHRDSWHEESRNVTDSESEFVKKDGYHEESRHVFRENGYDRQDSRSCDEKSEHYVASKRDNGTHKFDPGSKGSKIEKPKSTISAIPTNGEVFRQQMYNEYVHKVQEREERKHHKVIKISSHADLRKPGGNELNMNRMEKEFIEKAKNRMDKFGIKLDDSESEVEVVAGAEAGKADEAKCVFDGKEVIDAKKLPKHLQEFLMISADLDDEDSMFAPTFKATSMKPGVWSPGSEPPPPPKQPSPDRGKDSDKDAGIPPVWTPSSAGASPVAERKEFRPVAFESPVLSRKNKPQSQTSTEEAPPPWEGDLEKQDASQVLSQTITSRIVNSHSAPSQGLNTLAGAPRLPRAQNPTITLLQKAREGQIPRGAAYLEEGNISVPNRDDDKPLISPGEIIYTVKKEYTSEPETENELPKKMADLGPRKFEGIGPTTKEGVPLVLRSEVKENNQAKWYKKMYDSLHRADKDEDYITIRYKPRRGARYGYGSASGYLSEPEPRGYSDRSATVDNRRRLRNKENDFSTSTMPRKSGALKYATDVYRNQPGRIENYEPGRSSIADKETKEWWDEVMDIFDGWLDENGRPRGLEAAELLQQRQLSQSLQALSLPYRPDTLYSVRHPLTSSKCPKITSRLQRVYPEEEFRVKSQQTTRQSPQSESACSRFTLDKSIFHTLKTELPPKATQRTAFVDLSPLRPASNEPAFQKTIHVSSDRVIRSMRNGFSLPEEKSRSYAKFHELKTEGSSRKITECPVKFGPNEFTLGKTDQESSDRMVRSIRDGSRMAEDESRNYATPSTPNTERTPPKVTQWPVLPDRSQINTDSNECALGKTHFTSSDRMIRSVRDGFSTPEDKSKSHATFHGLRNERPSPTIAQYPIVADRSQVHFDSNEGTLGTTDRKYSDRITMSMRDGLSMSEEKSKRYAKFHTPKPERPTLKLTQCPAYADRSQVNPDCNKKTDHKSPDQILRSMKDGFGSPEEKSRSFMARHYSKTERPSPKVTHWPLLADRSQTNDSNECTLGKTDSQSSNRMIRSMRDGFGMPGKKSKSFVMPERYPLHRLNPKLGSRQSPSTRTDVLSDCSFVPVQSDRNHHQHCYHHRIPPCSSSSSTCHIITPPSAKTATPPRPFDQRTTHTAKPYMTQALKESGYESDSTLVFRRRDDVSPLSPLEQRLAYKTVQSGGDVPLHGLRKPAPERPKDDSEIEYFPISPTLTRIRVHKKNITPAKELFPYPIPSVPSSSSMVFAQYKRSAPSLATSPLRTSTSRAESQSIPGRSQSTPSRVPSPPPGRPPSRVSSPLGRPPSPPRRRSSRNNSTLRLYSKMQITDNPHPPNPRHEQCFTADSVSNIRFLRDRLSCKLERHKKDREEAQRVRVTRTLSTSPVSSRSKMSSSVTADLPNRRSEPCLSRSFSESGTAKISAVSSERLKVTGTSPVSRMPRDSPHRFAAMKRSLEEKPPIKRVPSKSPISVSSRESTVERLYSPERICHHSSRPRTAPTTVKKEQMKPRRSKKEQEEACKRLSRSPDLASPLEVRKAMQKQKDKDAREVQMKTLPSGTVVKSSTTLYSSARNNKQTSSEDKSLKVTVAISSKGRELIRRTTETSSSFRNVGSRTSSVTSSPVTSRKTTFAEPMESVKSRAPKQQEKGKFDDSRESLRSVSTYFTDMLSDGNKRKRPREKPQTITRSPVRKPETISMSPEDKDRKNEKKKVRKDKNGESVKNKKLSNGKKSDTDKKKNRKALGKAAGSEVARELKKLDMEPKILSLTVDEIKRHQAAMKSDAFFQNLFLRNMSPTPSQASVLRTSFVLERAKMFQDQNTENFKSEPSLRSLNIYLANKRPVSDSKFKNWERESISSRCSSPRGVSWPGRSVFQKISKFDSLLSINDHATEFGSVASFRGRSPDITRDCYKERSSSEPPLKILPENNESSHYEDLPPRPASPSPIRSPACRRIQSLRQQDVPGSTIVRKARARSAGEAEQRKRAIHNSNLSLSKSTSSLNLSQVDREEYQQYVLEMLHSKRKSKRYKDLQEFYASLERMGELERTTSTGDLRPRLRNEEIIDYDRWKEVRSKERAEQELKMLYGKLKTAQKESDFLFRPKEVDQFRWRGDSGLRCKEKSVENIREHFRKLEKEESELESTRRRDISSRKDVYKPLWRGNSVASVANTMAKKAAASEAERSIKPSLQKSLGVSKKFWSSLSIEQVNALKNQLNEIYSNENEKSKPLSKSDYEIVVPPQEEFGDDFQEDNKTLHVRCHSMVTPDICKITEDIDRKQNYSHLDSPFKRSGSISRGRSVERSQSDRAIVAPALTEIEKKRLSLTLSKEILDKVTRKKSPTPVTPRETRGAIAAASAKPKGSSPSLSSTSPRTCYSLEMSDESANKSRNKSDFLLVLTPSDESANTKRKVENVLDQWSRKPPTMAMTMPEEGIVKMSRATSGSELDSNTESSETSVKTVICQGSAEEVPRRVEFFEKIENGSADKKSSKPTKTALQDPERPRSKFSFSQSFADLKELFGESESAKYAILPFCRSRPQSTSPRRSPPASPDAFNTQHIHTHHELQNFRPRSVSPYRLASNASSLESIWQRSQSPDPEKYWRAYLKLVRSGAVKRLRAKFESLEELSGGRIKIEPAPKRFQSDPELTRNLLNRGVDKVVIKGQEVSDVNWLRRKYEPVRGRARRRGASPPISRVPLRMEDLGMPRINVISKLAELKERRPLTSPKKAETMELEAKRAVERIRKKFEQEREMSILGEMFTSDPNVHELRDIAPYLAGQWVAHKYPSRRDNARSLSSPELEKPSSSQIPCKAPERKVERPRATSSSPVRPRRPPSILKQSTTHSTDVFANQPFDPSKHRPRYRYQPPPPKVHRETRPWWPPIPTYTARPTVTFEGPASL